MIMCRFRLCYLKKCGCHIQCLKSTRCDANLVTLTIRQPTSNTTKLTTTNPAPADNPPMRSKNTALFCQINEECLYGSKCCRKAIFLGLFIYIRSYIYCLHPCSLTPLRGPHDFLKENITPFNWQFEGWMFQVFWGLSTSNSESVNFFSIHCHW